jgi:hypothetical protein
MSRIPALDPAAAQGKAKDLLDAVQKSLGITANMFRVAAQSPAALEGLLGLNDAVAHGTLGPKVREQIALAVAENQPLRLLPIGPHLPRQARRPQRRRRRAGAAGPGGGSQDRRCGSLRPEPA